MVPYGVDDPGYDGTEAAGNCVLVNDHRPNAETVGDAGIYFSADAGVEDLARQLERLVAHPEIVAAYRRRALARAERYSWDAVTDQYEQLLAAVCRPRGARRQAAPLLDRQAPYASSSTP